MRSVAFPFASRIVLVPFFAALLGAAVGCGGDDPASTTGSGGGGGSGGSGANTTGAGMNTTGAGMNTTSSGMIGMGGPPLPADATVYNLMPGAAPLVGPDWQGGFGVAALDANNYRLVWSGGKGSDGAPVSFEGSVWTPGAFGLLIRGCDDGSCELEDDDTIANPSIVDGGQYIGIKGTATTDIDGFDFAVDAEPVYFDLLYDGFPTTTRVVFGKFENGGGMSQPEVIPFALKVKEQ